jgi:hypothetical protein
MLPPSTAIRTTFKQTFHKLHKNNQNQTNLDACFPQLVLDHMLRQVWRQHWRAFSDGPHEPRLVRNNHSPHVGLKVNNRRRGATAKRREKGRKLRESTRGLCLQHRLKLAQKLALLREGTARRSAVLVEQQPQLPASLHLAYTSSPVVFATTSR